MARNDDGTLGTLLLPNEGRPAVTRAAAAISVLANSKGEATLLRDGVRIPVSITWRQDDAGRASGMLQVPPRAESGWYGVEFASSQGIDVTQHAVFVVDGFDDYYVIGLIGDSKAQPVTAGLAAELLTELADSDAHVGFMTGVTVNVQDAEGIGQLLSALQACPVPVFVGASKEGAPALAVERLFGPPAFGLAYGPDAYVVVPPGGDANTPAGLNSSGMLQQLRREHRAQRWSTAITAMSATRIGIRESLILLLDDPVDFMLCLPPDEGSAALPSRVRQGRSTLFHVPASAAAGVLLIDVTPGRGLLPRLPESAAAPEE